MKKQTALFLALLASAGFFLFLLLQTVFFAPPGITVHPARRTVAEDQRISGDRSDAERCDRFVAGGTRRFPLGRRIAERSGHR